MASISERLWNDLFQYPLSESATAQFLDLLEDTEFISRLTEDEIGLMWRSFLALDRAMGGTKGLRRHQLEVVFGIEAGKDVTLRAACGSGKTIAMALPALIDPSKIIISILPLKLIQENHF
ncbi:hypothetical protein GYMLUDRAFT_60323 [Collybiopsis luxurians FD-317 M1]|uniref:Unplaced genomic scaffold GYMLUscaffold_33, whole genome shotgun sequence n=1 Tax=Collybiopsis luxurians FD-317 M1 TaxID=944289 RepID=A0A0D0CTL1_9AGAR|nr:hypothetical protein GYMLUDRAFT_60323 [Collybiopsis luxurians FD-317 M1]